MREFTPPFTPESFAMPRTFKGTFEGKPRYRWTMMIDGKRLRVRCSDLDLPQSAWTKDGSYQAAKAWFEREEAELKTVAGTPEAVDKILEAWAGLPIEDAVAKTLVMADLANNFHMLPADVKEVVSKAVLGVNRYEQLTQGVAAVLDASPVQKTYHLEANAKRFLELELAKSNKARTYGELSESITSIINTKYKRQVLLYPAMDVREISKTTVENFYLYLRKESKREPTQQKKQFGFFKRLMRHLFQAELIDLPRNLDNTWDFNVTAKKIKEYDKAEVIAALKELPARLRLYALLGLNCGMLSVDVGNLRHDEIDMTEGRIKRKRTKTENQKDVPEVDYKLWPMTFKLLKQCLSDDPVFALTTKNGKQLVTYWIDDEGKEREKNMVRQQWKRSGLKLPHKAFRTIGATVIGSKADGATVGQYLGHSPKSIQDKHYKAPNKEQFDSITTWLGQEFGME